MRNLTATLCLTLVVLLFSPTEGWSADFQKGLDAYSKWDYATALREFEPLAKQGYAPAQNNLARMYYLGTGVPVDYVYSYMWSNIAASSGNYIGVLTRDDVAKKMTPSQLEKAQDLARECVAKKYKGC